MLKSLHIENVATIKHLDIDIENGLTVLTGETGAGKSMIIDSVNLLIGNIKGKELIRTGEDHALVEAYFTDIDEDKISLLSDLGIEVDGEDGNSILVLRKISADGRSVSKINGRNIPVSLQKDACRILINIHGQHDNHVLLQPSSHLGFLDKFANEAELLAKYREHYERYTEIRKRIKALSTDEKEKARMTDMLSYQIKEIDEAKLKDGEEELLLQKKKKIRNMEKILRSSRTVYKALYRNEKGISAFDLIGMACDSMEQLGDDIDEIKPLYEKLNEYRYEIEDIAEKVHDLADCGDENPTAVLDKIESRLDIIHKMQRKYGTSVADVLSYREKAAEDLRNIESSEELLEEAKKELEKEIVCITELADKLHESRKKASKELGEQVIGELKFLDMEKIRFGAEIEKQKTESGNIKFGENGYDSVEFLISTNPGEPMKPLAKIASGGELSRIMLAVKSVFSKHEGYETQIFDEVDTGVSGRTSQKIGIKLKDISENSQVICITHLAQIAALADNHLFIKKKEVDGRAETTVEPLYGEARVDEVARILGGIDVTATQKEAAREMIEQGKR
ncbi:MAG: DNA repair protein RecN [Ruminococcaceae bacterium]|nr:DNA repair protein RecN [Oscillospiraceae bacterium]